MAHPFDADAKARYVELIGRGRGAITAAEDLGFTWRTVRDHLRADRDFAEDCQIAERRAAEPVEEVLLDMALSGDNFAATKEWLHNRLGDRWRDTKVIQTQHTGPNGGPIQIATGTVDAWREILTDPDPEVRRNALSFAGEVPALVETTGSEHG